ncbi:MAG: FAD-dependent oxidoreductase [Patescibacteria group bacterium]|nr:FAD-dependent oxidoreductase [Patescibacteria group bacterium]
MNTYDTIILGGGPAGVAAGIYAARKKVKTLLISEHLGGQSTVSAVIENWIGDIKLSGFDLLKKLENHLRAQEGIEIITAEKIMAVKKEGKNFSVATDKNNYQTKTVIVATGAKHRQLGVPGEDQFAGKGVAYCSTCDAPMFKNKDVVVVGTGNSGLEAVIDLLPYANKIYLMDVLEKIFGEETLAEKIKSEKVEMLLGTKIKSIEGSQFVEKIIYENIKSGEVKEIPAQGIFVEIGMTPNSDCVKDLVKLNKAKEIEIDHKNMATSVPGIFAAGDVTDVLFKQSSVASGEGVKAALAACGYLGNK